jgi:hypothetical protein
LGLALIISSKERINTDERLADCNTAAPDDLSSAWDGPDDLPSTGAWELQLSVGGSRAMFQAAEDRRSGLQTSSARRAGASPESSSNQAWKFRSIDDSGPKRCDSCSNVYLPVGPHVLVVPLPMEHSGQPRAARGSRQASSRRFIPRCSAPRAPALLHQPPFRSTSTASGVDEEVLSGPGSGSGHLPPTQIALGQSVMSHARGTSDMTTGSTPR